MLKEAKDAGDNYALDNTVSKTCDSSGTTACYKGKTWTLEVAGLTKSDVSVWLDGAQTSSYSISYDAAGNTVFNLILN